MSPIYALNGKLLLNNSQLTSNAQCCCSCPVCTGGECCGNEWPRSEGICCENVWRLPSDTGICCDGIWYTPESSGQCCGGSWYPAGSNGICCGDTWYTEPGECCGTTWYAGVNPCPSGQIFVRWGVDEKCCGCLGDQIYDPILNSMVSTISRIADLCCPACDQSQLLPGEDGCLGRCCIDGTATQTTLNNCAGIFSSDICGDTPCPKPCCEEDSNGDITCNVKEQAQCGGSVVNNCDDCKGACCTNATPSTYIGQTTQTECESQGGIFHGLNSTEADCGTAKCRDPFTESCCESKTSSGSSGLIFTQPKNKRSPPFNDTGFLVTVTGTTDSEISIRGAAFGVNSDPPQRCPVNLTFLLCGDSFEVEPSPCGTTIQNVDLTVCWEQRSVTTETLNFSGCNNLSVPVGSCLGENSCNTIISYNNNANTTNSNIAINGSGPLVIEANSGPIIFNGQITYPNQGCGCSGGVFKIILTGSSTANNTIGSLITDAKANGNNLCPTSLTKEGSGRWLLSNSSNNFTGGVELKQGELVLSNSTTSDFTGSIGAEPSSGTSLVIGSSSGEVASLLLKSGVTISNRTIRAIGSGQIIFGSIDNNGTATFSGSGSGRIIIERDIRLISATGGTLVFGNIWDCGTGSYIIDIGGNNNNGTILLNSVLPSCLSAININSGLATLSGANTFTCTTTINGGTAKAGNLTAFGTGDIMINTGGTLDKNGFAISNNIINNGGIIIN